MRNEICPLLSAPVRSCVIRENPMPRPKGTDEQW